MNFYFSALLFCGLCLMSCNPAIGRISNSDPQPTCPASLQGGASSATVQRRPSRIATSLSSLPIHLTHRRKPIETQIYRAQPRRLNREAPVLLMSPGLSKPYFVEQVERLAEYGYVAVSYDHLNVGNPVVGPLKEPSVEEDALLAEQVFDSLPSDLRQRPLILVGHSRGALVSAALAKRLRDRGNTLAGLILFQPYIYWHLDHILNQLSAQIEKGLSGYLKTLVPFLARLLYPASTSLYDRGAEITARSMAKNFKNTLAQSLNVAHRLSERAHDSLSLPSLLKRSLRQVLPDSDPEQIDHIIEKLKAMQPSPQRDAEFLGAYLLTLDLPIEIVISENDELSSPEMAANLKEFTDSHGINQIRWSLLEGESHFFPYEKAETMANWISRFWIERAKP